MADFIGFLIPRHPLMIDGAIALNERLERAQVQNGELEAQPVLDVIKHIAYRREGWSASERAVGVVVGQRWDIECEACKAKGGAALMSLAKDEHEVLTLSHTYVEEHLQHVTDMPMLNPMQLEGEDKLQRVALKRAPPFWLKDFVAEISVTSNGNYYDTEDVQPAIDRVLEGIALEGIAHEVAPVFALELGSIVVRVRFHVQNNAGLNAILSNFDALWMRFEVLDVSVAALAPCKDAEELKALLGLNTNLSDDTNRAYAILKQGKDMFNAREPSEKWKSASEFIKTQASTSSSNKRAKMEEDDTSPVMYWGDSSLIPNCENRRLIEGDVYFKHVVHSESLNELDRGMRNKHVREEELELNMTSLLNEGDVSKVLRDPGYVKNLRMERTKLIAEMDKLDKDGDNHQSLLVSHDAHRLIKKLNGLDFLIKPDGKGGIANNRWWKVIPSNGDKVQVLYLDGSKLKEKATKKELDVDYEEAEDCKDEEINVVLTLDDSQLTGYGSLSWTMPQKAEGDSPELIKKVVEEQVKGQTTYPNLEFKKYLRCDEDKHFVLVIETKVEVASEPTGYRPKENQERQANELIKKVKEALSANKNKSLFEYESLDYLISVPRFTSLRDQTKARIMEIPELRDTGRPIDASYVMCATTGSSTDSAFNGWMERVRADVEQKTLFVLVDDECHYAVKKNGTHDNMVNNVLFRGRSNVLVLHVSATPQNCLMGTTRIKEENIVRWMEDENTSMYRSLDYFVRTATWSVPPNTKLLDRDGSPFVRSDLWYFDKEFHDFTQDINTQLGTDGTLTYKKENKFVFSSPSGAKLGDAFAKLLALNSDNAENLPSLCDPKTNRCFPTRDRQRVRKDAPFADFLDKMQVDEDQVEDFQGQCNAPKRLKQKNTKTAKEVSAGVKISLGHYLACDYLMSLAYFAVFRCKRDDGMFVDETNVLKAEIPDVVNKEDVEKFLEKLAELKKFETNKKVKFDFSDVVDAWKNDMRDDLKEEVEKIEKQLTPLNWKQYIELKLKDEKSAGTTNDETSWFSDTDRTMKCLLERASKNSGNMVMARVHANAHSISMQHWLRHGVKVLNLYHAGDRPVFATLADTSALNFDLQTGLKEEAWLTTPLRDGNGKTSSTIKERMTKWGNSTLPYEALLGLPCLVFLCEQGRMGDTFPHSLRMVDLRLRASGTYSTFVQDFGTACRYSALEETSRYAEWSEVVKNCVEKDIAMGFAFARVAGEGDALKVHGHLETLEDLRDFLQVKQEIESLRRYKYPLPTVLVQPTIFEKLNCAVRMRNALLLMPGVADKEETAIINCLAMNQVDKFIRFTTKRTMVNQQIRSIKEGKNCLHTYASYRECFQALEANDQKSAGSVHYNVDNLKSEKDDYRFLLFAQTQIGKTGVFLEFLRKLHRECKGIKVLPPILVHEPSEAELETLTIDGDWRQWCLPRAHDAEWALPMTKYQSLLPGQYQVRRMKDRWERLRGIVGNDMTAVKVEHVRKFAELSRTEEVIVSSEGWELLNELASTQGGGDCKTLTTKALNWDKRFQQVGHSFDDIPDDVFAKYRLLFETQGKDVGVDAKWSAAESNTVGVVKSERKNDSVRARPGQMPSSKRLPIAEKWDLKFFDAELSIDVNIKYDVSIPLNYVGLFDSSHQVVKPLERLAFLFISSYGRADTGYFDLSTAVADRASRGIVVVVRHEEFAQYREMHGRELIIVGLPSEAIEFKYKIKGVNEPFPVRLSAQANGLGFSRLFIQLLSSHWKLPCVWMMDDNVVSCFQKPTSEGQSALCSFDVAMRCIERIMLDGTDERIADRADPSLIKDSDWYKHATTVRDACPKEVGVLGMFKGFQHVDMKESFKDVTSRPFNFSTHSISSFYLVNIEATVQKRVFFPAKTSAEDVEFMHCVRDANLSVVKFARFAHMKRVFPRAISITDKLQNPASSLMQKIGDIVVSHDVLRVLPWGGIFALPDFKDFEWIIFAQDELEENKCFEAREGTDRPLCALAFAGLLKSVTWRKAEFLNQLTMAAARKLGSARNGKDDPALNKIAIVYRSEDFSNEDFSNMPLAIEKKWVVADGQNVDAVFGLMFLKRPRGLPVMPMDVDPQVLVLANPLSKMPPANAIVLPAMPGNAVALPVVPVIANAAMPAANPLPVKRVNVNASSAMPAVNRLPVVLAVNQLPVVPVLANSLPVKPLSLASSSVVPASNPLPVNPMSSTSSSVVSVITNPLPAMPVNAVLPAVGLACAQTHLPMPAGKPTVCYDGDLFLDGINASHLSKDCQNFSEKDKERVVKWLRKKQAEWQGLKVPTVKYNCVIAQYNSGTKNIFFSKVMIDKESFQGNSGRYLTLDAVKAKLQEVKNRM